MSDRCSNAPWVELWSCPKCYHDHKNKVSACEGCGVPLACTIEDHPVYICSIRDNDEIDQ